MHADQVVNKAIAVVHAVHVVSIAGTASQIEWVWVWVNSVRPYKFNGPVPLSEAVEA